jgi:hypothetical protein
MAAVFLGGASVRVRSRQLNRLPGSYSGWLSESRILLCDSRRCRLTGAQEGIRDSELRVTQSAIGSAFLEYQVIIASPSPGWHLTINALPVLV